MNEVRYQNELTLAKLCAFNTAPDEVRQDLAEDSDFWKLDSYRARTHGPSSP